MDDTNIFNAIIEIAQVLKRKGRVKMKSKIKYKLHKKNNELFHLVI